MYSVYILTNDGLRLLDRFVWKDDALDFAWLEECTLEAGEHITVHNPLDVPIYTYPEL